MGISINVAGVWKVGTTPQINVAGVWKSPDVSINVAGVWKSAHTGLSVDFKTDGRTNTRLNATCYSGERFYTSGVEYEITAANGSFSKGNWLVAGSNSDVWIEDTLTGGTWSSEPSGRVQMTSNRSWTVWRTSSGVKACTAYFRAYDAATGGNLLDTSLTSTFSATYEFEGCPLCCFTPETPVLMWSGLEVPIGQLKIGDKITVKNPNTGELEWERIDEIIEVYGRAMYTVYFDDGTQFNVSDDHPMSVEGKGYSSINPVYDYKDLKLDEVDTLQVGDRITTIRGPSAQIVRIERFDYPGGVITLSNSFWFANGKLVY